MLAALRGTPAPVSARREGGRPAPAAAVFRALEALRSALDACAPTERAEILALIADELGIPTCGFAA